MQISSLNYNAQLSDLRVQLWRTPRAWLKICAGCAAPSRWSGSFDLLCAKLRQAQLPLPVGALSSPLDPHSHLESKCREVDFQARLHFGPVLHMDSHRKRFINNNEATVLLAREYRAPSVVLRVFRSNRK